MWGAGTGHHAGMVYEAGSDPVEFSHGSDPCRLVTDSLEAAYQPAGGTFLRLPI